MIIDKASALNDLSPFADLGTAAPQIVEDGKRLVCRLFREGRLIELIIDAQGTIVERSDGRERTHASFKALLASESFANLRRWADSQRIFLKTRVEEEDIQVSGAFSANLAVGGISLLDDALVHSKYNDDTTTPRVLVALIDGPAGIGKTGLVRSLSYKRASSYITTQRPLILHVESRGRVLQNISDLMAFSLQTLRLNVTYDQIPILVRNGLVTLAVDGFDELGDPNGYELAWAQVNDLIVSARGAGALILSGRETFISRRRMEFALSAMDKKLDRIETFTIEPIRPSTARSWLTSKGWQEAQLESDAAKPLFETGSYALRPFFLKELSRAGVAEQICDGEIEDLLTFLVDAMIGREADKFGIDINSVTSKEKREQFVETLMEEIARDLAENQTDALPDESISWLAEIVAHNLVPSELAGILKNRASVVAFLTQDERRGYKRFLHDQLQNYFLSKVTVNALSKDELPKYIRRNILGPDFLENFCDVLRHLPQDAIDVFVKSAQAQVLAVGDLDRSKRNLGALIFAACSVGNPDLCPSLSNLALDEIYCTETVSNIQLHGCTITQLYARGADLRNIQFDSDCFIISMIADEGTLLPILFPTPGLVETPDKTISSPDGVLEWLYHRRQSVESAHFVGNSNWTRDYPLFELLSRIARYKPFWLKDGDERSGKRILEDKNWEKLKHILLKHNFIVERDNIPSSGRPGSFFHIRNRQKLLDIRNIPDILFLELINVIIEEEIDND